MVEQRSVVSSRLRMITRSRFAATVPARSSKVRISLRTAPLASWACLFRGSTRAPASAGESAAGRS